MTMMNDSSEKCINDFMMSVAHSVTDPNEIFSRVLSRTHDDRAYDLDLPLDDQRLYVRFDKFGNQSQILSESIDIKLLLDTDNLHMFLIDCLARWSNAHCFKQSVDDHIKNADDYKQFLNNIVISCKTMNGISYRLADKLSPKVFVYPIFSLNCGKMSANKDVDFTFDKGSLFLFLTVSFCVGINKMKFKLYVIYSLMTKSVLYVLDKPDFTDRVLVSGASYEFLLANGFKASIDSNVDGSELQQTVIKRIATLYPYLLKSK